MVIMRSMGCRDTVHEAVGARSAGRSPTCATSDLVLTLHYIPAPSPTGELQSDAELVKEVQLQDIVLEAYAQP
jgi:hypothetical protein